MKQEHCYSCHVYYYPDIWKRTCPCCGYHGMTMGEITSRFNYALIAMYAKNNYSTIRERINKEY